jgi:hypothetical protein
MLQAAREEVLIRERASDARRRALRPLMDAADDYRELMRDVDNARAVATLAGPDHPAIWDILEMAAEAERMGHARLAEVGT